MTHTLIDKLTQTPEGMRLYQQERAIQEATDLICEVMEEKGIGRADLARRLGKTKGYITQLLDGRTNMTVRTLSDVLGTLDCAIHFYEGPLSITVQATPVLSIREGLDWVNTGTWPENVAPVFEPKPVGQRMVG